MRLSNPRLLSIEYLCFTTAYPCTDKSLLSGNPYAGICPSIEPGHRINQKNCMVSEDMEVVGNKQHFALLKDCPVKPFQNEETLELQPPASERVGDHAV